MFNEIKCPICGKKELEKFNPNERFFVFQTNPQLVCKNCGCSLNRKELNTLSPGVKISRRAFFSILFEAASEIYRPEKLPKDIKNKIIKYYKGKIKSYYQEVAEAQAELFFEIACNIRECELFGITPTTYKKNKLIAK